LNVKTTEKAVLNAENCVHCKRCIDEQFCNFEALSWDLEKEVPIIDPVSCEGCRACMLLCSEHAFGIQQVDSGKISVLESSYRFPVITGETILGAQTSGKLVTELKKYTERIAKEKQAQLVIYDGPPGIGCPVIASASGLDYIIIVIEPTSASLHDAKRFIEIAIKFQIPFGIIINKCNISEEGSQIILTYLKANIIECLGEIPLDKDWPFSVAKRQPFVKYRPDSEATRIIHQIVGKLIKKINAFLKE
jgi:MinD superfamily P-loop ATPase